ncbi:tRNA pseudouridine synthase B [Ammonifex degensii KC4]|uniref:tRNA pseudouridine synthase B n=1 Tax=Ammonifex degensii (strain DSM 10501 / KC4) TaxID=429009 RepID=C9R8X3_AMMDK|nr:tRNA pseudouridine(55) synthase TruB [Ammonifex degensii]ACX52752.1 tRNA pseudouridine synthase B [Ammonifex degensii KC4]
MIGVLNVLKPPGMTSHDVVDWLRRLTGEKKVGHAGTLDPDACGVMVLLIGKATRAAQFLVTEDKEYRAEAVFGVRTDTLDLSGRVLACQDASWLTPEAVAEVLPQFTGSIWQKPPMFSAVRYKGKRLHELARAGQEVEVPPRRVEVYSLQLLKGDWGKRHPRVWLHVHCGKGTYVRSLVADLGEALGTGACLGFLLRTRVGRFGIGEAYTLEELARLKEEGKLAKALIPLAEALGHLPAIEVGEEGAKRIKNGGFLSPAHCLAGKWPSEGTHVRVMGAGELLALALAESLPSGQKVLRPVWVL